MNTKMKQIVEWRGTGRYASRWEGTHGKFIHTCKCDDEDGLEIYQVTDTLQIGSGTTHFFWTAEEVRAANPQALIIDYLDKGELFLESSEAENFLARYCETPFPYYRITSYWKNSDCPNVVFNLGKLDFGSDGCDAIAEYFSVKPEESLPPVRICMDGLLEFFNCIPQRLYFYWDKPLDDLPTED